MAVSYLAVVTPTATGHTTGSQTDPITPTFPTGSASGARVFVIQATNNTTAASPTDWTAVAKDVQVGPTGTAPGAGTGRRFVSVHYRDYDGVWTMPAFALTSATQNTHAMSVITLRKGVFDTWDTPTVSSAGNTGAAGTAYSVTVPSFATTSGGVLLIGCATNDNVTATTPGLTQTGATFANLTERSDTGSATGNDVSIKTYTANVTTGATATLTHSQTLSGSSEGGSVVVQQTVTSSPPSALVGYATVAAAGGTVTVTKAAVDASLGGTVTNDDGMIAIHSCDTGALSDMTAATGTWTLLASLDGGGGSPAGKVKIWLRTAASEGASWAFGQNASADGLVTVVVLRGMAVNTTDTVAAITSTATGTSRVTPDVDHAGTASSVMLAGAAVAANNTACTFTSPGDMVEIADAQSSAVWACHAVAWLATPADPTGTKTFTASTATQQGPGVQWALVVPPTGGGPVFLPAKPILLNQAALVRAHYW
jgi:hypothetical protein